MARREDDGFLKRLFDEPAGGKSPKSRASKRARRPDSRAHILAVLEAAGERLEEGVVLDDALLAGYLDGALADEERVALEGLLARSHDLRDQLAAAGEARAVAIGGKEIMPEAFVEDFDAVPAPQVGKPARPSKETRGGLLPHWLTALAPGRRWAMAAVPVIIAVVVVAVIGPEIYRPERMESPKASIDGTLADKDTKRKTASGKRQARSAEKETAPQTGTVVERLKRKPKSETPRAGASDSVKKKDRVVSSTILPLDDDLRKALVRMGLRQNRPLSAAGSAYGRAGRKQQAAKPPSPKPPAQKKPAVVAEERKKREAKPSAQAVRPPLRAQSTAKRRANFNRPSVAGRKVEKAVERNCPGGAALGGVGQSGAGRCCESRRVDLKLLRRLLAGGPPLQKMRVVQLSSKTCLLTLPMAATGK